MVDFNIFDPMRPLGRVAADRGVRIDSLAPTVFAVGLEAAKARFRTRVAELQTIVRTTPDRIIPPGELIAPPPIPAADGTEPPRAEVEPGGTDPTHPVRAIGTSWSLSVQRLANTSASSVVSALEALGDWLADGVEEGLADALETASFTAAQSDGLAFSTANLASLWAKHAALRSRGGGFGPPVASMICSPAVLPSFMAGFHAGIPGLRVIPLRTLPAGRYYLMPASERSPLLLPLVPEASTSYVGMRGDSSLDLKCAVSAFVGDPTIRTTVDGSPRWVVKGGV